MVSILPGIGVDDVVRKPVNEEQFLYKVKTAVANKNIKVEILPKIDAIDPIPYLMVGGSVQ